MKKTILILLISASIYLLLNIIFKGIANPKNIEIGTKIISAPEGMYLQEIFSDKRRKDVLDFFLSKEPYHIDYPNEGTVAIRFSNSKGSTMIVLMPALTRETFEDIAETNAETEDICISATVNGRTYLVNNISNEGYVILSDSNATSSVLKNSLCR